MPIPRLYPGFILLALFILFSSCASQKGCKGVRFYTTQHGTGSKPSAKPHSMAISRSGPAHKHGSATLSLSGGQHGDHHGSGTLSLSGGSHASHHGSGTLSLTTSGPEHHRPGNMGFYKPKAHKNGSISMTFSKKKSRSKPLPPWTKKAKRADHHKAKSGVTKGGRAPSRHSMED